MRLLPLLLLASAVASAQAPERSVLVGAGSPVLALDVSPDGRRFVAGSADGSIRVWDTSTWECERTLRDRGGEIRLARFAPDGSTIVTTEAGDRLSTWDAATGEEIASRANAATGAVCFEPGGRWFASQEMGGSGLRDGRTGDLIRMAFRRHIGSIGLLGEGRFLVQRRDEFLAEGGGYQTTPYLAVVDIEAGRAVRARFECDPGEIVVVEGSLVLLHGSRERAAHLWDLETGSRVRSISNVAAEPALGPGGRAVAWGGEDSALNVLDVRSGDARSLKCPDDAPGAVRFDPQGRWIAAAGRRGHLHVWKTPDGGD